MVGSNSEAMLAELADRARRSYADSVRAWVETAYTLLEARQICEHGRWLAFLAEAGIPRRTASNMIRVARMGVKVETVANLGGIKATLACLASDPPLVERLAEADARTVVLEGELRIAREIIATLEEIEALQAELAEHRAARIEAETEGERLRQRVSEAEKRLAGKEGRIA